MSTGPTGSRRQTSARKNTGGSDDSTAELLRALTEDVRSLVREELQNAQDELTDKARAGGKGAAMLGGAAVLGALSAGTSTAALLRILDRFLPRTIAAVVASSILGGVAAKLAAAGIEEIRRTFPVVPERAVSELREDVQAATASAEAPRDRSSTAE